MKKSFIVLLLPVLLGVASCHRLTPEEVEACVIEGTSKQLPLIVQQLPFLDDITVDSMQLIVKSEPMSGYLYTTWTAGETSAPIIVNVTDIRKSKENQGYVEWQADWEAATMAFMMNAMHDDFSSLGF